MEAKAPQLVWDRGVPIWRASRAAIKAGFPTKRVNLKIFADNEAALIARCRRLTAEQNEWLSGRRGHDPVFDGTIRSVIIFWQTEPTLLGYRDNMRVEIESGIAVTAKTVADLRALATWPDGLVLDIHVDLDPRLSVVRVERAS